MKNKYYILVISLVFILCGCTANYDIEIYNDEIRQDFSFYETDKSKWNLSYSSNLEEDLDGTEYSDNDNFYKKVVENESSEKTQAFSGEGNLYQDKKIISTNDKLGLRYKYNYKINNFSDALIPKNSFKYFNVLSTNDTYVISTSKGVSVEAFQNYKYLNLITIHLKTNHKVKENNADRVDGYNYYWDINEINYKDKSIYIELYKDKYVFNYENKITKILIVSVIIAILVLIAIIIFRKKANKNNKI